MNLDQPPSGVDGRSVANFVLDLCERRGRPVTNLALQKIVYFCHVWNLVRFRTPLIKQNFEAWQYGPVLQYLYREFKSADSAPIIHRCRRIDPHTGERRVVSYSFDGDTELMLTEIVDFYSRMRPSDLIELSHAKDGPWDKVWRHQGSVNPGMKISNEDIISFYSNVPSPFSTQ